LGNEYIPILPVALELRIVHLATNQTLIIKESIPQVGMEGILGGVVNTEEMNELSKQQLYG